MLQAERRRRMQNDEPIPPESGVLSCIACSRIEKLAMRCNLDKRALYLALHISKFRPASNSDKFHQKIHVRNGGIVR